MKTEKITRENVLAGGRVRSYDEGRRHYVSGELYNNSQGQIEPVVSVRWSNGRAGSYTVAALLNEIETGQRNWVFVR